MSHDLMRPALLVAYATISVAGMVLLKAAPSPISAKALIGGALYLAGFAIWTGIILRIMPLSQAFPIAAGALMLGTQIAGCLLLKERIGVPQSAGVLLILVGVVLINTAAPAQV